MHSRRYGSPLYTGVSTLTSGWPGEVTAWRSVRAWSVRGPQAPAPARGWRPLGLAAGHCPQRPAEEAPHRLVQARVVRHGHDVLDRPGQGGQPDVPRRHGLVGAAREAPDPGGSARSSNVYAF
jgi:hypothetical protein